VHLHDTGFGTDGRPVRDVVTDEFVPDLLLTRDAGHLDGCVSAAGSRP
jgi:hypothetical protein